MHRMWFLWTCGTILPQTPQREMMAVDTQEIQSFQYYPSRSNFCVDNPNDPALLHYTVVTTFAPPLHHGELPIEPNAIPAAELRC